jgi:hypothetical protein
MAVKWEYVVERMKFADAQKSMNRLGAEGWEAFAVTPQDDVLACLVFFRRQA